MGIKRLKYLNVHSTLQFTVPKIESRVNEGNKKMYMNDNVHIKVTQPGVPEAGTRDCRGQVRGGHHYCL